MSTIGILGSGNVGRALTTGWRSSGHRILVGSRTPDRSVDWLDGSDPGIRLTGLAEAAAGADVVVNALPGAVAVEALRALHPALRGKILVDVANAVVSGPDGLATALCYPGGSLAGEIQRVLPGVRVVKTLNTVGPADLMARPTSLSVPLSVFLSGDDPAARRTTAALLGDLGWPADWVVDLGGLATAWWPESFLLMVRPLVAALGPVPFGLAVASAPKLTAVVRG